MIIQKLNFEDANKKYQSLSNNLKIPGINPEYVISDSLNYKNVEPVFLFYENNDNFWIHNCLLGVIPNTEYKDIFSSYGYAGPVSNSNDRSFINEANNAYLSWASSHNIVAEFISYHPILKNYRFDNADISFNRSTVMVNLERDELFDFYKKRTRRDIRRAYRLGVSIIINDKESFIEPFKKIYFNTMIRNSAENFYFFNDNYLTQLVNSKNTFVVTAFQNTKLISAAIFLISGDYMEYHLSGTSREGLSTDANKVLLHEAMIYGKELGIKFAHLGGGSSQMEDDALLLFKSGFSKDMINYSIGKKVIKKTVYEQLSKRKKNNKILHWR